MRTTNERPTDATAIRRRKGRRPFHFHPSVRILREARYSNDFVIFIELLLTFLLLVDHRDTQGFSTMYLLDVKVNTNLKMKTECPPAPPSSAAKIGQTPIDRCVASTAAGHRCVC